MDTSYDKIHLYDAFGFAESDTVAPGSDPVVIEVDGETLGLAICYDIRFPELFRALADRGASTVLLPASWGAGPGKVEQWELLVRARAIDSTTYVLACDQADPGVRRGCQCDCRRSPTLHRRPCASSTIEPQHGACAR